MRVLNEGAARSANLRSEGRFRARRPLGPSRGVGRAPLQGHGNHPVGGREAREKRAGTRLV